jgi:hypothetical protein
MVSMMLISGLIRAEDRAVIPAVPMDKQSSHDENSKKGDDSPVTITNVHQIDLDNTEVDGSGNWLNKRIWYERAQAIFDEIRAMVSSAGDLRIQFSNEVNAVGQKIDTFFETVYFTKAELDDKFKEMLIALDTEKKLVGDLSEEERNLQTTLKQEIGSVDQIGKDIKSIGEVDNKIDQTLIQALKTIDECRDYETKSWDTFKSIGKELDDKKSRNLYYQMNNYKQNIDQKMSYLKATLLPYLHNVLVAKIDSNIAKINETIGKLKTKGIDLEKIMSKTQEDDEAQFKAREKAASEIAVKKALDEEQAKSKEAADKAAKELEEANKKSFTNVMNSYYEATIGKIVKFFNDSYVSIVGEDAHKDSSKESNLNDESKSHGNSIVTHIHSLFAEIKIFMHKVVEHVMIYFGSKPAVKEVIAEKIEEKIAEKIGEMKDAVQKSEVTSDTDSAQKKDTEISDSSAIKENASDANVAVQSIKNDDVKQQDSSSFYSMFKSILDLIGIVVVSIYKCIAQFLKLLLTFFTFLMSGN